ncbi:MAG: hypothetical protein QME96_01980 [Myxococcota bacterium]|nr:hypothetical protein [Myxococcota bacterium]
MIPDRLRVGGLAISLPPALAVTDAANLAVHIGPFAVADSGPPDVVVRSDLDPSADFPAGSFRIEVNRVLGGADGEGRSVKPYDLAFANGGIAVRGPLGDAISVVSAIHLGLAHLLPRRGGLMLHASAVRAAGVGFVFPGASGAGKTTAAEGFHGGEMLADERCIVRLEGAGTSTRERWMLHSAPMWGGKYGPVVSAAVPPAAVVLVRKDAQLGVEVVPAAAAMTRLAPGVVQNRYDAAAAEAVLAVLAGLVAAVPVIEVSFRPGDRFADALLRHVGAGGGGVSRRAAERAGASCGCGGGVR